jgi:hypothetical protein
MAYRHAFGIPPGRDGTSYRRFLDALRREAERGSAPDGSLELGWRVALLTARRLRSRR